jgi:hypothetical protein
MQIIWVEDGDLRPYGGHGIDFFSDPDESPASLVAVLRGFDWLHFEPDVVEVGIRPASSEYPVKALAAARGAIERFVRSRGPFDGQLTKIDAHLYAHVNG